MSLSLHAALIPNWLQTLGAVDQLIGKAELFAAEQGRDEETFLQSRLADDMLPLAYQIASCRSHTALALKAASSGIFSPEMMPPPMRFDDLRAMIAEARAACEKIGENQLEQVAGNDLVFSMGDKFRMNFTVRDFLLSFSQPNLYFHATTTYAIMRMQGVTLGKRDFLGAVRIKQGG